MNFLMMAAHDTITSSITTLVWELARHPEWQDRLREAMLSVAPAGEGVGHHRLGQLEMTACEFKDALRLVPPVPRFTRRPLSAFEYGGYLLPAGPPVGARPPHTPKSGQPSPH